MSDASLDCTFGRNQTRGDQRIRQCHSYAATSQVVLSTTNMLIQYWRTPVATVRHEISARHTQCLPG